MTQQELFDKCIKILENIDKIAVRDTKDGKIGSYYLSELTVEQALKHVFRFLIHDMIPYTVIKDSENNVNTKI